MLQLHPAFAGLGLGWSKIGIRAGQGHEGLVCVEVGRVHGLIRIG